MNHKKGVSNCGIANILVKASQHMLVQLSCRAYAASYNETPYNITCTL